MPDEKKPLHPETNFLPPLSMILSFFKKKPKKNVVNKELDKEEQKEVDEKAVEKLIEKLHERDKKDK
ncbi:MAG TPA: hypothetical protein VFR47_06495 [Anaerolineales bacterium]|nr:hypothetical protein [Anaerolineales bacterium]